MVADLTGQLTAAISEKKKLNEDMAALRASLEEKLSDKESELVAAVTRHAEEICHLQDLLSQANNNITLLKGQAITKFEEGFQNAKTQVLFLDPKFNVKAMGTYKQVVSNELVGPDSDSEDFSDVEDMAVGANNAVEVPPVVDNPELMLDDATGGGQEGEIDPPPANAIPEPEIAQVANVGDGAAPLC